MEETRKSTSGGTWRVVVVDDHRMVVDAIGAMLGLDPGIDVVGTAGSLEEALVVARAVRPDVVVADYDLPDGTGIDLARQLAGDPETRVIVVTGLGDENVAVAAMEAGCAGFLTKGRPMAELVDAVHRVARGGIALSPDLLARVLPRLRDRVARPGGDPTSLTEREREVLVLMATGASNQAIAEQLFLSVHTVRNHVKQILVKLGAHSKLQAVSLALRSGLIEPPR